MPPSNVVVDGSNIATEGRTTPSLDQLDQAVRQYLDEHPGSSVTVVVDASFGHRIESSERAAFEQAVAHGELVSPPAGAIGRGDAFLLRIAERIGARVLSNDSFREFHEEHPWLFDEDRLVGGTPVPGVGWIFTPRRPVRGPLTPATAGGGRRGSRKGTGKGQPQETEGSEETNGPMVGDTRAAPAADRKAASADSAAQRPKSGRSRRSSRGKAADGNVQAAIAEATEEALTPGDGKKKKGKTKPKTEVAPEAVNDPLPFITFASEHPVGSEVQGTVVSFTSHGAMAQVEDMLCYVPLAGLGDPPPRRARDVLRQGETRTFELVALDPARRGAQLALPEVVAMHGEIVEGAEEAASEVRRRRRGRTSSTTAPLAGEGHPVKVGSRKKAVVPESRVPASRAPARARGAKSAKPAKDDSSGKKEDRAKKSPTAKKAAPAKKAPAKKAGSANNAVTLKKSAASKSAPARKTPAKKTQPTKTQPTKTQPTKTQPTKTQPKKAAPQKGAPAKKSSAAKAASGKKASATGKAPNSRKVPASKKASGTPVKATRTSSKTAGSKKRGSP